MQEIIQNRARTVNRNKAILAAFLLFLCVPPYFIWNTGVDSISYVLFSILSITEINAKQFRLPIFFISLLYFYLSIVSDNNIWGWIIIISVIPIFFSSPSFCKEVYKYFYKIFMYTMIISFFMYLIVCIVGIDLPHYSIKPLNLNKIAHYYAYPFLVSTDTSGIRFHGLYDEPGVIGTISGIILLIEHFDLKKKGNVALLIMTVFTFSMFFYVIFAIYILLFERVQYKLIIAGIVAFLVFYFWSDDVMYELVFKRFMLNDKGQLIGNTREHGDFGEWFDSFRGSSGYYWGLGSGKGAQMNDGGSSYKQIIVDYGVVFFVLYCASFVLSSIRYYVNRKCLVIFILLFFLTIYQRPFITSIAYVFFFYASPLLISDKELTLQKSQV